MMLEIQLILNDILFMVLKGQEILVFLVFGYLSD